MDCICKMTFATKPYNIRQISTHPNKPQNIRRIFERLYFWSKIKKTFKKLMDYLRKRFCVSYSTTKSLVRKQQKVWLVDDKKIG